MDDELLTTKEAVAYAKIGRTTLEDWIKKGRIKPVYPNGEDEKTRGRKLRFIPKSQLTEVLSGKR